MPFAFESFDSRTGAQPLYATQWAVGTEAMAEPSTRLAIGSSPLIEERPAIADGTNAELPEAHPLPAFKLVAWAIGLAATGLGLGAVIASLAG